MNLNINQIKAIFTARNLTLYADGRMNLFAFRSTRTPNGYDDRFYTVRYKECIKTPPDKNGSFLRSSNASPLVCEIKSYRCTVDPGETQLTHPTFKEAQERGTGILAEHKTYWYGWSQIGTGEYRHDCLIQVGDVDAYRDNNRDKVLDFVNRESGWFAFCIHCFAVYGTSDKVNGRSAGCTDFHDWNSYKNDFIPNAKKHPSVTDHKGLYPYTLFLEADIIPVL